MSNPNKRPNPYGLRLSEEVMNAIKKSAAENERSVNKEIEFALKQYLKAYQAGNR